MTCIRCLQAGRTPASPDYRALTASVPGPLRGCSAGSAAARLGLLHREPRRCAQGVREPDPRLTTRPRIAFVRLALTRYQPEVRRRVLADGQQRVAVEPVTDSLALGRVLDLEDSRRLSPDAR